MDEAGTLLGEFLPVDVPAAGDVAGEEFSFVPGVEDGDLREGRGEFGGLDDVDVRGRTTRGGAGDERR